MIGEVIQSTISEIIPNTFPIIADEEITVPFCIHEEKDEPIILKAGLSGYSWTVEIAIIHSTPDAAEQLAERVIAAINALEDTSQYSVDKTDITADSSQVTVDSTGTIIVAVNYLGGDSGFDRDNKEYIKTLVFIIETSNR